MTEALTVAIYARKSGEDERSSEDGRSVDRQVRMAREFAGRRGWLVAESFVITEEASGADFTRPGLQRLLAGAKIKPRPFDAVVVMSIDRLGREQVRMAQVVQELHGGGVAVWTYQDGQRVRFDTPIDKLMLGVHGFGAEEYRHQVQLKTREALVAKARRGHATGQRTYGYALVRVGDHSERQIDEAQAAVVRRVFEMAAAGAGDLKIARTLADEHVPAPGPKGWSKQVLRHLLRNAVYVGRVTYGRSTTVDDGAKGRRVVAPKDDWTVVEVPQLRIIDDALWAQPGRRSLRASAALK
jgi:DNA invertase Pin-like site-specific DNA recombinase